MNEEQYEDLKSHLRTITNNQVIIDKRLRDMQGDLITAINNQKILGRDQDRLIEEVAAIKKLIKR